MCARRGIAQRYIDRLDLVKKGLLPLFSSLVAINPRPTR
jgi:hypothetical protein